MPSAPSVRTSSPTCAVSCGPSAAVGSSHDQCDRHRLALAAGQRPHRILEALEVRVEPAHDVARRDSYGSDGAQRDAQSLYCPRSLATAYSNAALGEKQLRFAGKFIFCRLLVIRHDKTLRDKLIKSFSLISIQIRSLQYIAKDRNFLISDNGIRHYTAPGV
jgi:hypothetical protein